MFPEGAPQRARLPSLLRLFYCPRAAEAALGAIPAARAQLGSFAPPLGDSVVSAQGGVLQFTLTGTKGSFPRYTASFADVDMLTNAFAKINTFSGCSSPSGADAEDRRRGESVDTRIGRLVGFVEQALRLVLPRIPSGPVGEVERHNVAEIHADLEMLTLDRGADYAGPDYFDGAANGGDPGLLSDGLPATDLAKLVADASGRPFKPSLFFSDLFNKIGQTTSFWKMPVVFAEPGLDIGFEHLLQDGDARAWVVNFERQVSPDVAGGSGRRGSEDGADSDASSDGGRRRPRSGWNAPRQEETPPSRKSVFAAPAEWLIFGLVLYSSTGTADEDAQFRKLVFLLASVPEMLDKVLPPPPGDATPSVRLAWHYTQTVLRHVSNNILTQPACRGGLERPDLQLFWELFACALKLVPGLRTRGQPQKKRLALFAAIAFATRILAATGKVQEPKWHSDFKNRWRLPEAQAQEQRDSMMARLYAMEVGTKEAWSRCAITGEISTPLEDTIIIEAYESAIADGMEPSPETAGGEGNPEVSGAPDAAAEDAALGITRYESEDTQGGLDDIWGWHSSATAAASSRGRSGARHGGRAGAGRVEGAAAIFELLRAKRRLLVFGGPGSGRSVIVQGVLAHACQDMLEPGGGGMSLLPLRIPVAELAALAQLEDVGDALQEYAARTYDPAQVATLSFEQLPQPPFPPRCGHQMVEFHGDLFVLGGVGAGNTLLHDAWVSRDRGKTWEELPRPMWPARHGHQAVIFDDKIVVVAGLGEGERRLRDAWETLDGNIWTELPCPRWSARSGHQLLVLECSVGMSFSKERLVLFGGSGNGNVPLRDAWASADGGFTWEELEQPPWPARHGFSALAMKDRVVVCGGLGEGGRKFNDSWVMTGNMWRARGERQMARKSDVTKSEDAVVAQPVRWERVEQSPWPSRDMAVLMPFRGEVVLFGGVGDSGAVLEDAWISPDGLTWRCLPAAAWRSVACRYGHRYAVIEGQQVIIGGADAGHVVLGEAHKARPLLLALDGFDAAAAAEETGVSTYLDKLLRSELHHLVVLTTGQPGLDHLKSMHLQSWKFALFRASEFGDREVRELCRRKLVGVDAARAAAIQEAMLDAQYQELAKTPFLATVLLQQLLHHRGGSPSLTDVYQRVFELSMQSLESAKRRDTTEFKQFKAAGVDVACCELALEVQSHCGSGSTTVTPRILQRLATSGVVSAEAAETVARLGRAGHLMLFECSGDGLRFRNHTVQEFLAARQLWRRLNAGDALPIWIIREGPGSESAVVCGRFFCALAADLCKLAPQQFEALCEGLGAILRNMARVGDRDAVRTLLGRAPNRQALLSSVDALGQGHTALHLAAGHGHAGVLRAILELAPDASALNAAVDAAGFLPLHYTASNGHEGTTRALLEMSTERIDLLTATDHSDQCYTALHLAAKHGHHRVLKTILDLAPCPGQLNAAVDLSGSTPLHLAAQSGHEGAVRTLLGRAHDRGVLVATPNRHERRNPLHLAAECGEESVVRALLELVPKGSSLATKPDKLGLTPLHLAAERGHEATIRALMDSEQELSGRTALVFARESTAGQTALHLAADSGNSGAVRALLTLAPDRQALVCAVDRFGRYTALHLAAERGRAVAARALLELTEDRAALLMMEERFAGQMALHLAALNGHDEVVQVLLEFAPEPAALLMRRDRAGGFMTLHLAAEQGHEHVVQVILELAPNRKELLAAPLMRWSGLTPLHLAAYRGREEAAAVLQRFAPDRKSLLLTLDSRGRTPSDIAAARGHRDLAAALADGASP